MFETAITDGVLQIRRPGTRWLSSGWSGGFQQGPAAYNLSVPEGWERTDLDSYVAERKEEAGFDADGPALLTGVDLDHARGARYGPVEVYATAGISNPAALPMEETESGGSSPGANADAGTVNLLVGTDRALDDGALATLFGVVVEAKTASLLAGTGFPGTTTDAVVVGCDPSGDPAEFAGSATAVGAAARACIRDAVRASLASRYPDSEFPDSVADAEYGVETTVSPELFDL